MERKGERGRKEKEGLSVGRRGTWAPLRRSGARRRAARGRDVHAAGEMSVTDGGAWRPLRARWVTKAQRGGVCICHKAPFRAQEAG